MNQSSRDDTLLGVRPSPGPGRGAVSFQSSRDKRPKRSLPGSTVRREGRAISPLRWDVLAVAFVLAIPLLALGLRGDFEWSDVMSRLPWCLLAAWVAVALLHWASQPRGAAPRKEQPAEESTPTP